MRENSPYSDPTVAAFHDLYMAALPWAETYWRGVRMAKCPLDLWTYQEIIHEVQPTLIVETGTFIGGSALFFADVLGLAGIDGRVLTIDVQRYPAPYPDHPRITYLEGSSTDPAILRQVADAARGRQTMVALDSDHSCEHVTAELDAYAPLVSPGSYLVVEDTDQDGAKAAVPAWLAEHPEFVIDRAREKHLMTLSPGGWLLRK